MFTKRRLIPGFFAALAVSSAALLCLPTSANAHEGEVHGHEAQAPAPGATVADVRLKVERDGRLSVTERVSAAPGTSLRRVVPLVQEDEGNSGTERIFAVTDSRVEGQGTATTNGDEFTVDLQGTSTVHYVVHGAVAEARDGQEVRWQVAGGWNVPLHKVTVSFLAPKQGGVQCVAGEAGSSTQCTEFGIGHTGRTEASQLDLQPDQRMEFTVTLPPETVAANARMEEPFSLARAFAITPASGAGLIGVGLLLIAGFGLLWSTRGRDSRVVATEVGPVDVLITDEQTGVVSFASPDGVLPGQVGTVIDEHVDAVDITASVIDLAVRNYIWLEELPGEQDVPDWRIVALNPPDEALRPYERAVYGMLFDQGKQEVRVSELKDTSLDLATVAANLYGDVVEQGWFARRPDSERSLFWWLGAGLAIGGVALTVVLALTTQLALLGVAVVLGGIALAYGSRLMPARTKRGSALVAQVRGLRDYLAQPAVQDIPAADREMVFSRSLPYAVVLGTVEEWLAEFAGLDSGADGTPGLYWYGELEPESVLAAGSSHGKHVTPDLQRFRSRFPLLLAAMDAVLARAGHLRALK